MLLAKYGWLHSVKFYHDFTVYSLKKNPPSCDKRYFWCISLSFTSFPFFADSYHIHSFRHIESLSYKLTEYTILGLEPGDRYRIELGTKTGTEATISPITEIIMTKPLPVKGVMVVDVTPCSAVIQWHELEGHPCLKGLQIFVTLGDGRVNIFPNVLEYSCDALIIYKSLDL